MKRRMQLLMALLVFVVALPLSYATSCQAGCSSCQYPASNCPDCPRYDYIHNWSINPCIDQGKWNFSTPVSVSITGFSYYISTSGLGLKYYYCQNVSIRAIMYYGTGYEQDSGWGASDVPLVPKTFNFTANHSGTATLRIMVKYDSGEDWDIEMINMTIAENTSIGNIYYGACTTNSYDTTEGVGEENAIAITFENISGYWGASTLYTLFMLICVALTWYGLSQVKGIGSIRIAMCFLVWIFLMFLGAATGVIGYTYLFLVFVGFAIWAGIKIKKALT